MAEEYSKTDKGKDENNLTSERASSSGESKFSRAGKDSSISSWLASKDEVKPKAISKGFARRARLNPISKKQKKKNSAYDKAKKEFYKEEDNRKCYCCGATTGLSIHHKEKRLQGNMSDLETFITLCLIGKCMDEKYPDSNHSHSGGCHGWVEGNKSIAREIGLLK